MGIASDTFAQITRDQYADWKQRYYPKQQELMGLATSGQLMNDQLGRVAGTAANSLASAQTAQNNKMARMGVASNTNPNDNSLGLRESLAVAGAKNGIREQEQTRQTGILTGADAGLRDVLLTGGKS